MNSDYEKTLEAQIDRALKSLPELSAPRTLVPHVLAALAQRAAQPWYRQPWQAWPPALRYAALTILICSFGAVCFASWQLTRAAGTQLALQEVGQAFSGVMAWWNACQVVVGGLVVALQHVNPLILAGCLAAVALAWALFVGLGTACAKLALARRPSNLPARLEFSRTAASTAMLAQRPRF